MDYSVVVEGETRLKCPVGGGLSKDEEVFFNPHMSLNRDLTVALCKIIEPTSFVDAMAATGARGIRVANEAGVDVTLNDLNPKAVELIRENARLNNLGVEVTSVDVRKLFSQNSFDYVDLDPFGTPVEYTDSAISCVRHRGVLGVSATDTSALCGSHPKACLRKYGAHPLRCDCYNEVGLRILLGHIAYTALRHHRGIHPLFSHSTRHYMRCQIEVNRSYQKTMKNIGYLQYCFKCLGRWVKHLNELQPVCACGGQLRTAGPMWVAEYADPRLCSRMANVIVDGVFQKKDESLKLIANVGEEQAVNLPYYDLHKLCRKAGVSAPKTDYVRDEVTSGGYLFTRTHFAKTGVRTDMPVGELIDVLKH